MPELTDLSVIRTLCEKYDFALSKGFGQNFIINPGLPPKIVDASGVDKSWGVLEIGPGIGPLTQQLAQRSGRVVSVELDRRLLPVLAVIFLVCLIPTGMVSLGSITMAAAYPVLTLVYSLMRGLPTRDVVVCTVGAAIMGGMVIWMHRSNIQRIRDGKEYRFGQKHKRS